jgi:hypothetical protein
LGSGRQVGGGLIGKVYGHLSNEHAQRQAGRVVFGEVASAETPGKPAVVEAMEIKGH